MSEWIPVKTINGNCLLDDRLKDICTNILVTYETPTGRRYVKQTSCYHGRVQKKIENIIAWMPLPEPYKEG